MARLMARWTYVAADGSMVDHRERTTVALMLRNDTIELRLVREDDINELFALMSNLADKALLPVGRHERTFLARRLREERSWWDTCSEPSG